MEQVRCPVCGSRQIERLQESRFEYADGRVEVKWRAYCRNRSCRFTFLVEDKEPGGAPGSEV